MAALEPEGTPLIDLDDWLHPEVTESPAVVADFWRQVATFPPAPPPEDDGEELTP